MVFVSNSRRGRTVRRNRKQLEVVDKETLGALLFRIASDNRVDVDFFWANILPEAPGGFWYNSSTKSCDNEMVGCAAGKTTVAGNAITGCSQCKDGYWYDASSVACILTEPIPISYFVSNHVFD